MYQKRNMETYITICKVDSQRECAVCLRELKSGALYQPRVGGMDREMGGRFKRKGIYVYLWLIHVGV